MGGGSYSSSSRSMRAEYEGYATKSATEIFSRNLNSAMSPNGIDIRESRDSEEHPNSVAIIIALDVTGSMGSIPLYLVREGLPAIMQKIIDSGIKDPQVLFLAIGDHEYDRVPLQVGQFESSDELLDHWLTKVYIESGGGGNGGESYSLAHYFAANHTSIDCFEKRGQKGFLFTIGDEPTLPDYPARAIKNIMGCPEAREYDSLELLEAARKKYNVYHLHLKQGSNGRSERVMDGWKQLIGNDLIIVEDKYSIAQTIEKIIVESVNKKEIFTNSAEPASVTLDDSSDVML